MTLHVDITDVRSDKGQVLVALYDKAEAFPSKGDQAVKKVLVKAANGQISTTFDGLKPGTYAIVMHHDENEDGKMNYSFIGMPKEGYGFSNDAKVVFGPPSFEAAKIEVKEPTSVKIKLRYFL